MARALSNDPYKNYRFQVKFEGESEPVAGMTDVSAISKSTEAISYRISDTAPTGISTPGLTSFEPITLSRGLTKHKHFHDWARAVDPTVGFEGDTTKPTRKDVTIELHNELGKKVVSYKVLNCWVSEYQVLPDLNSQESELAIQTITLQHEGFVRE